MALLLLFSRSVVSDSCNPVDCSVLSSAVHGISQARILEWVAFPPAGHLADAGMEPVSIGLAHRSFITEPTGKSWCLLTSSHT